MTSEEEQSATGTPVKKTHRRTNSQVVESNKKDSSSTVIEMSTNAENAAKHSEKVPTIEKVQNIENDQDEVAIKLDSVYKHYGSGKSRLPVLIGLNMEVPTGQIYGLLGKKLQKLVKIRMHLTPYVCTERMFDSRRFMYKNFCF